MTAQTIFADLLECGIEPSLTPDGKGIAVPAGRLSTAQRAAIMAHKSELIEYLVQTSLITSQLLNAAMRVCDRYNDSEAAREEMRLDCLSLPPHLQQDLLDYFTARRKEST